MTSAHLRTATAAATDVGRKRSGNEDSYDIWVSDGSEGQHAADTLIVVCDGMGGSNAGEVASRMAAETVVRVFAEDTSGDAVAALKRAVEIANDEVHEHGRSRIDLNGMGTTCTAIALRGDEVFFGHVGDSRAYLVRDGRIRQLTADHSLVAQLVSRGQITPAEAKTDPRRNVVTRSVGVGPTVDVDAERLPDPLELGDTLLVCSDGLHGLVTDDEMARLASGDSLDRACRELIALANERGGPDNITVALARLESDEPQDSPRTARAHEPQSRSSSSSAPDAPAPRKGGGSKQRTLQMLIVALIVLALALCGIAWALLAHQRAERDPQASNGRGQSPSGQGSVAWR
ncbi:MAG: Stp1/IreP family PP2C-type Ser/Thr phosphatase [Candidatus Eisenbacteria bacterium]